MCHLVHLSLAHLDGQEDEDERRKPDTTSSKPQNAWRSVGTEVASRSVWSYNTGETTKAGQHSDGGTSPRSVEELRRRCIQNSVEEL